MLDNSGVVVDAQGQPVTPPTAFAVSPIPGASNALLSLQLSTTGAVLSSDKTSLSFSPQRVGTTSSAVDVTLSSASGSVNGITASGGTDFTVTNGCSGATLTGSATCVLHVSFAPAADGSRNAALSISSNAITITDTAGTQSVALAGTGIDVMVTPLRPSRPTRFIPSTPAVVAPVPLLAKPASPMRGKAPLSTRIRMKAFLDY